MTESQPTQKVIQTPLFHGLEMQPHLVSPMLFSKKTEYSNTQAVGVNPVKKVSSQYNTKVKFESRTDL